MSENSTAAHSQIFKGNLEKIIGNIGSGVGSGGSDEYRFDDGLGLYALDMKDGGRRNRGLSARGLLLTHTDGELVVYHNPSST